MIGLVDTQGGTSARVSGRLLAMLIVLVIGFYIVRDITGPLKQVVGVANQIAVGNLNVEPISAGRKDEVGALARSFDRMIMSLREQVLLVQDIADGDLTGSIKPQSANDDMGNALAEMWSICPAWSAKSTSPASRSTPRRRRFPRRPASSIRRQRKSPRPRLKSARPRRKSPRRRKNWCAP